tara:strand:- start:1617 stop:2462 length:846 start_codon:yes stop_codon:yes gene_type:complete
MIIWLASYPKSGNTWIRSLISSYLFSDDGNFNFRLLKNIEQFSSSDIDNNLTKKEHYQSRISKNWIPTQKIINKSKKVHFLKTHNAMCSINGYNFTDKQNTLAAIYIARDPRNLITSLSNHYELTLEESLEFLTNKRKIIFPINQKNKDPEDFNFLADWSTHYRSWKNINFCPIKIIKYEDFILDSEGIFIEVLEFLSKFISINLDNKKIKKALDTTSFENLRKMEKKEGFIESVTSLKENKKIPFFYMGKKNDWKKMLDKKLLKKIENHFRLDMEELGYL